PYGIEAVAGEWEMEVPMGSIENESTRDGDRVGQSPGPRRAEGVDVLSALVHAGLGMVGRLDHERAGTPIEGVMGVLQDSAVPRAPDGHLVCGDDVAQVGVFEGRFSRGGGRSCARGGGGGGGRDGGRSCARGGGGGGRGGGRSCRHGGGEDFTDTQVV